MKLILLLLCFNVYALTFKIGAIAPDGTNWAKTLKKMSKEIKKATDGKVKFKFYYGGVAGDESDVVRKIRVSQFHGGVFTGKTLGDIVPDIRVIELPFNFYHSRQKGLKALKEFTPDFNQKLKNKGFINLGFYEIGQVYVVSTKKVKNINEMRGIKMWSWQGDSLVKAMIDSLGLISVPLSLPDVLSSLSTGIIDSAYAPPLGILGLQWHNQVKYLINFPTAFSIGALLVSQKRWDKLSDVDKNKIMSISKKYVDLANKYAVQDNLDGIEVLKKKGIEFVDFSKKDIAKAETIREKVIERLKGKVIKKETIEKLNKLR
ncbi:MAG: TRAP transporter substrate-binding protein DctP [Bacteriovoracaceae bacterium]|jgi:TRAP-type C4-dicarboxylate transport system substrate-binding protein|nr:TRAP transporter substrate-binding protein DctP [Bacteriovoracaceae bacterium]